MYYFKLIFKHPISAILIVIAILCIPINALISLFIVYLVYNYHTQSPNSVYNHTSYVLKNTGSSLKKSNKYMSAKAKSIYLQSPQWLTKRQAVLHRDNYTCQMCSSTNNLNIHHVTYERLGNENLSDLVTLCNNCHSKLHNKLGYDRDGYYPIN